MKIKNGNRRIKQGKEKHNTEQGRADRKKKERTEKAKRKKEGRGRAAEMSHDFYLTNAEIAMILGAEAMPSV